jgi:hypothetical protein
VNHDEWHKLMDDLAKRFVDDGKLIEVGFIGLRKHVMHPDAPQEQVREMRMAFMAGAQHLFASILAVLDPDREPTERDMQRMGKINDELEAFAAEMAAAHYPTRGNA